MRMSFPDDPNESEDTDEDGVGDNAIEIRFYGVGDNPFQKTGMVLETSETSQR